MATPLSSGTATHNQTGATDPRSSQARQVFDYLARQFRWPEGVAEACATLEERYPQFSMYYAHPLLPRYGRTGYFARPRDQGPNPPLLYGATPAALEATIRSGRGGDIRKQPQA